MTWPAGHPKDHVPRVWRPEGGRASGYELFLDSCGLFGQGFQFSELVDHERRNKGVPVIELWPCIVPTLRVAIELRRRLVERRVSAGLLITAAYRPTGGARRSAHKVNRALDLDLPLGNRRARPGREFVKVAAELYAELLADGVVVGMGTYGPGLWSSRVHVDVGHEHPARPNTWTIHRGGYLAPAIIDVLERTN